MAQQTLSNIEPGSILELVEFEEVSNKIGDTVVVRYHNTKGGKRERANLLLPERMKDEAKEKIPCLLYYGGKKKIAGGKDFHITRFIRLDEVETDSELSEFDCEHGDDTDAQCQKCMFN